MLIKKSRTTKKTFLLIFTYTFYILHLIKKSYVTHINQQQQKLKLFTFFEIVYFVKRPLASD